MVSDTEITVDAPDATSVADGASSLETDLTAQFEVTDDSSEHDDSVPNAPDDNDYVFGAPVIDSVSPGGGPLDGGNTITITGSGFANPALTFAGVDFDPTSDTTGNRDFGTTTAQVVSDTEITVTAPDATTVAGDAGVTSLVTEVTADFNVTADTSEHDDSVPNAPDDNDYVFGAPVIDSVSPGGGPLDGGNTITITGSGFANPALTFVGVDFDPTSDTTGDGDFGTTTAQVVSDTEITVSAPDATTVADDAGVTSLVTEVTADFNVTADTSEHDDSVPNATEDNDYVFGAPVIDSVSPSGGPLDGGNTLTITGSGFANPALTFAGVDFDPLSDTTGDDDFGTTTAQVVSDTEITLTVPDATSVADGATSLETDVTADFNVTADSSEHDDSVPNATDDNDYSFVAPTAPPCGSLNDCQGSTNSSPGGSATATSTSSGGTITADASGEGGITVGQYSSDPVGAPTFDAAGSYFDVSTSNFSDFTSVAITDCDLSGGNAIEWWNPSANSGAGGWEAVTPQSFTTGPPPCVTMTLSSTSSPTIAQLTGTVFGVAVGGGTSGGGGSTPPPTSVPPPTLTTNPTGYFIAGSDGSIQAFGSAQSEGSVGEGGIHLNKPIVAMATTPDGQGYWLVASDGGVFTFGDAQYFGSTGNLVLDKPIVGLAASPVGGGYWLVAADGGVFAFGDARYNGSTGGRHLERSDRRRGRHSLTGVATGWWRRTVASSPSVMPPSSDPPETSCSTSPSSAWRRLQTGPATGWWPPMAASSPSAMPRSMPRRETWPSTSRLSGWRPPPTAMGIGWWRPTVESSLSAMPPSKGPGLAPMGHRSWLLVRVRSLHVAGTAMARSKGGASNPTRAYPGPWMRLRALRIVRLGAVMGLVLVICGIRLATQEADAATPNYTIVDLGVTGAGEQNNIFISHNSGLVLDLNLNEIYDINTGKITPVTVPTGFQVVQMNDAGDVVGNYETGGAVWNPFTGAVTDVTVDTSSVHTFPLGYCDPGSNTMNCPYDISPVGPFIAYGINDNGDVVGQVNSQLVNNTFASVPAEYFAAIAPGGQDADFTGLVPAGINWPWGGGNYDQCGEDPNAMGSSPPTTASVPYAWNAFAVNNSDQILGTPCNGEGLLTAGGEGVAEVWAANGSVSSTFPPDNGIFNIENPSLFNGLGDFVAGPDPGSANKQTLELSNGQLDPILEPDGNPPAFVGGLNDDNEVAGTTSDFPSGAFLWAPGDTDGIDLQTLLAPDAALTLRTANGIDNAGSVIGQAVDSNGQTHDYVAIPGPVPLIDSVAPSGGPLSGGNQVTITGTGFQSTGLTFDGVQFIPDGGGTPLDGLNPVVDSDTEITVTVPDGTSAAGGKQSLLATVSAQFTDTSDNTSDDSQPNAPDDNDYVFGAPVIDSVSPGGGPLGGGNTITITGSGFANPALTFAGVAFDPLSDTTGDAAFYGTNEQVISDTEITVDAPDATDVADGASSLETDLTAQFDVTADTSEHDDSVPTAPDDNDYVFGAPVIDSVSPGGGPLDGGNTITITGSGFSNPALTFVGLVFDPTSDTNGSDAFAGSNEQVVSDTEITLTAPDATTVADDAGDTTLVTEVTADFIDDSNTSDDSVPNAPDDNDYVFGAPVIDSVSPGGGPLDGGNTITITGSGFSNPALTFVGVDFDPTSDTNGSDAFAGSNEQVVSDTEINLTAPDATTVADDAGVSSLETEVTADFDVTADTSEHDDSVPTAPDDNDYVFGAPVIDSVSPGGGPLDGGNTLTITGSGFSNPALTFVGVDFDPTSDTNGSDAFAGSNEQVVSDTEITVDAPDATTVADDAGVTSLVTEVTADFDVTADTPEHDDSVPTAPDDNDYVFGAPVIDSISPRGGPLDGGNTITITGSGFQNPALILTGVDFDPTTDTSGNNVDALSGTSAQVVSDTEITVIAPSFSATAEGLDGTVDTLVTADFVDDSNTSDDSVPNATDDNDYSFVAPTAPPCGSLNDCQGSTNSSPGGSATATSTSSGGTITADASGEGGITVGQYSSDPVGAPTFDAAGSYFDVSTSNFSDFTSVAITDCDLSGGNAIEWWNPSANSGAGGWEAVTPQSFTTGPPPCVTMTLSSTSSPTIAQLTGTVFGVAVGGGTSGGGGSTPPPTSVPPPTLTTNPTGYFIAGSDGSIQAFGSAQSEGSVGEGGIHLNKPIVGMATTPDGQGYWLVASDGGVFTFGDAQYFGSTGNLVLDKPIVAMAATPDGKGYWLVASDGGVFAFGDAQYDGSMGGRHLNAPIVGVAGTLDGGGYWLVAKDGGVFSFGDASFFGSTGNLVLNKPIVGMAATPNGGGYWLVAADGGVFTFGDAAFYGSTGNLALDQPVVGMAATPDGDGYWLVASDGGIFAFGDAPFEGSGAGSHGSPVVAIGPGS